MRVIVTGANGKLGRAVVSLLLEQGMEVVGLDKEATRQQTGASFLQVDLCNLSQVLEALAGADAVVHLGAILSPGGHPSELVYGNNIMSQFNVFEAADRLDIHRVVSASSFSAFGFPYQHRWSLLSSTRAREILGFVLSYRWLENKVRRKNEQFIATISRRNHASIAILPFFEHRQCRYQRCVSHCSWRPGQ